MGKVKDFDQLEEYKDLDSESENNKKEMRDFNVNYILVLKVLSMWFIRIGVMIAFCLLIMFFISGNIFNGFIFIFSLIIAFCFGYFFMYLLDQFMIKFRRN